MRRGFAAPPPDPENRNERNMKMSSRKQSTAEKSAPIEVRVQAHGHGKVPSRRAVSRGKDPSRRASGTNAGTGGTRSVASPSPRVARDCDPPMAMPATVAREPPSRRREPTESKKYAPDALGKLHPCKCRTATVYVPNGYGARDKFYGAFCKVHRLSLQSAPLRLPPSPPREGPGHLGREVRREGRETGRTARTGRFRGEGVALPRGMGGSRGILPRKDTETRFARHGSG